MPKKTSQRWLKEHFSDPYVRKAQQSGYRSRAVYKLLELQNRDHLFRPGMLVIDIGSAPGGWSQVVAPLVKPKGKVFSIDLLPMAPIPEVEFIQGDFTDEAIQLLLHEKIRAYANNFFGAKNPQSKTFVDWVISDMAPNMSGNESVDIPRSLGLAESVLTFALESLNSTGGVLIKVLQGDAYESLVHEIKRNFKNVQTRKPKASRGRSREVYILARGKRHAS